MSNDPDILRECIKYFFCSLAQVHFSTHPDPEILETLVDHIPNIRIHLSRDTPFGFISDFTGMTFTNNIISASLETDIFTDWIDIYSIPNIENLTITCYNKKIDRFDDDDLRETWTAIYNLPNLKDLTLDLANMKDTAITQAREAFIFPGHHLNPNIITTKKCRRKGRKLQRTKRTRSKANKKC